jgi:hypothetical protein
VRIRHCENLQPEEYADFSDVPAKNFEIRPNPTTFPETPPIPAMTSQSQLTHTLLSKREITHRLEIKISKVWYDEMIISCFCSCLCSRSKGGADSFPRFLIEDTTLICHSLIGVLSSTELCCGIFLVSFAPMRRMGSTMYFDA